METVPRNKRYAIKNLTAIDETLSIEELKELPLVKLLKMIEDRKVKAIQIIKEDFKPRSLLSYCGCEDGEEDA